MKKNKKEPKKKQEPIILELEDGKVLEILSIENVVDPEDEYNKLYEDCEKLYPEMPKA
ncbi:MAG: hypothetical protein P8I45_01780 [Nitrospinaceae bacterium]|nr:hypothetical protein [Nitrospinaceae bacterium]